MAVKKQKKIKAIVKLNIPAGQATPGQSIGTALGQHGVPLMDFCKEFNARTKDMGDDILPVVMTVYEDRYYKNTYYLLLNYEGFKITKRI